MVVAISEFDLMDLPRRIDDVFAPAGPLADGATETPDADFVFEERPQQRQMAAAVAQALIAPHHLVVEAGTGVGKTFAYLAPLLLRAAAGRKPAAVSTFTINLQEQLIDRDLPFLQRRMGLALRAVLCKGRNNYLCWRRLFLARKLGADWLDFGQQTELETLVRDAEAMVLAAGEAGTDIFSDGSLSAFSGASRVPPAPEVWREVCAEYDNCLNRRCAYFSRCFLMRARLAACTADLLVLNHHLLFAHLALTDGAAASADDAAGFLPEFDALVLDEAHCVENAAAEHFGLRLTQAGLEYWLRRLYAGGTDKSAQQQSRGLLVMLGDVQGVRLLQNAWRDTETFFSALHQWAAFNGNENRRIIDRPLECAAGLPDRLQEISALLLRHAEAVADDDLKAELQALGRRGSAMAETCQAFARLSVPDHVYWLEAESARRGNKYSLCSAPVEVAPLLAERLFRRLKTVVLTSATLAVRRDLEYFKARVGAGNAAGLVLGSPFNFQRQMRIFIVADMPDPRAADFPEALARGILFFARKTRGRAFALFTNAALMRAMRARLEESLRAAGLVLLVQGEGLGRHALLERFRRTEGAVLFGLDSFWMGVDVRGEALSNVIITRLPFAVPDEPLTQARMQRVRARGQDAFETYALPEAVLKFRQGVGRLIRTATDEGIVAVLDPRIITRAYGRTFLEAVPECPVERLRLQEMP